VRVDLGMKEPVEHRPIDPVHVGWHVLVNITGFLRDRSLFA
jgi:hypothetical protein